MPEISMPLFGSVPLLSAAETAKVVDAFARSGLLRAYRPDDLLALAREAALYGLGPGMGPALSSRVYPKDLAFVDGPHRLTSSQLQRRCERTADALRTQGLRPGDRIGLLSGNSLHFYSVLVGAARVGIDVGYLNTGFSEQQLADVCRSEELAAVVAAPEYVDRLPQEVTRLTTTELAATPIGSTDPDFVAPSSRRDHLSRLVRHAVDPIHRSRHIILTSGTTGQPKGAARSGGGVDAIIALVSGLGLKTRQRHLIAAPMFHAWGWSNTLFTMLLSSTVVTSAKFDAETTLALIERERCEVLIAVPAMLQRILALPERRRRQYDCSSLTTVAVSGSALPPDLALAFMDEFGDVLYNLFGSTEAAFATVATPDDLREAPGTAGRPLPGVTVRVVDSRGRDCPVGTVGAILVGSGTSFEGYTSGEDKRRIDGLIPTGDQGRFDDRGRLFVVGREDDMIVSGGENVYPIVVEQVLRTHPDVADAAVVGVRDERFGQSLIAHVVPRPDASIDSTELGRLCRTQLAEFEVPRRFVVRDELPRNATGKVLTRVLQKESAG